MANHQFKLRVRSTWVPVMGLEPIPLAGLIFETSAAAITPHWHLSSNTQPSSFLLDVVSNLDTIIQLWFVVEIEGVEPSQTACKAGF